MPKGIPLTKQEMEARRQEIAVSARDLILRKGFRETSMREIAQAADPGPKTADIGRVRVLDSIIFCDRAVGIEQQDPGTVIE